MARNWLYRDTLTLFLFSYYVFAIENQFVKC
jgi:hypothetical protein